MSVARRAQRDRDEVVPFPMGEEIFTSATETSRKEFLGCGRGITRTFQAAYAAVYCPARCA